MLSTLARAASRGRAQLRPFSGSASRIATTAPDGRPWDVAIVGGGHNGLVAAAYLAKAGKRVIVLERRHCLGGAAVTEEIVPGFQFSRASYVYSLFRPQIVRDLELKRHGLHVFIRNPASFTPTSDGRYLLLGPDMRRNVQEIAKFSEKDARAFPQYCAQLDRMSAFFEPFLDEPPVNLGALFAPGLSMGARVHEARAALRMAKRAAALGTDLLPFVELLTAPARKVLERWFESEPLRTTLATDAVIGAMTSPSMPQSGYVLFHHVMGEVDGAKGVWGYVRGGMGALSQAIASAAREAGAVLHVNAPVARVLVGGSSSARAEGVELEDGTRVQAQAVMSNASPAATFLRLLPAQALPADFVAHIRSFDVTGVSAKINVALDRLPTFKCLPSGDEHLRGTIHFEDHLDQLEEAFLDAKLGQPSRRPVVEMVLPSTLDPTLAPPGKHVCLLFVQYAPYHLKDGSWDDPGRRDAFADRVFEVIEEQCPGFTASVVGRDVLTPLDLERVFGLPQGNIFHGAMGLDQLFWLRPAPGFAQYATPVQGLYLCGAGSHPGGGVMGAPGRNAAMSLLQQSRV